MAYAIINAVVNMKDSNDLKIYKAIKPKRLSDEIFEQIKNLIFNGTLKPGDKLPPERDLADHFNVGRPCLREALTQLRGIGLIETRKKEGYFVRPLSENIFGPIKDYIESEMSNLIDFLEFRKVLDTWCARQVIDKGTAEDFKMIKMALEDSDTTTFHISIARATHNLIFVHLVSNMHSLLTGITFIKNQNKNKQHDYLSYHKEIYDAIINRDKERAERAIKDHIDDFIRDAQKGNQ